MRIADRCVCGYRVELYDLFVNLSTTEITVAPHAKGNTLLPHVPS